MEISNICFIFVVETNTNIMSNYKFKIGQFIVFKWRPVEDAMITPLGLMYSEADKAKYGVWRIDPYRPDDDIEHFKYKMHLVPVGKSADYFLPMDRYTLDYWDIPDEMIFDDQHLAEMFVNDFLQD